VPRIRSDKFGVLVRMRGIPAKTDLLRERLCELAKLTRAEAGCLSCEMIENQCDATEFTLLKEWSLETDHVAHFVSGGIREAMRRFTGLLTTELDLHKHVLRPNSIRYGTNSYCLAAP